MCFFLHCSIFGKNSWQSHYSTLSQFFFFCSSFIWWLFSGVIVSLLGSARVFNLILAVLNSTVVWTVSILSLSFPQSLFRPLGNIPRVRTIISHFHMSQPFQVSGRVQMFIYHFPFFHFHFHLWYAGSA